MCNRRIIFMLMVFIGSRTAWSQERVAATIDGAPLGAGELPLLKYLVHAKIDGSGSSTRLVALVGDLAVDQSARSISVAPASNTEPDLIGKLPNPGREIIFPSGRKPIAVNISEMQFFTLRGEIVELSRAQSTLKKMTPLMLFDNFAGSVVGLPEAYRSLLDRNCLMAVTVRKLRPRN